MTTELSHLAGALLGWLNALRAYVAATILAHLGWEAAWPHPGMAAGGGLSSGVLGLIVWTGADTVIALCALVAALILVGDPLWPQARSARVSGATLGFGMLYALAGTWFEAGTAARWTIPLLHWSVVPGLALWAAVLAGRRSRLIER